MVGDKGDQSRSEKQKFKKKQMSFLEQNRSAGRQLSASFSPSILRGFFSLSVQFFFFFFAGKGRPSLLFSPFLFGSLTRPLTPSGFQEHPEDTYQQEARQGGNRHSR